ncbi:hypothetical protein DSO57_1027339 [Entomophthora muscae]|uniref:Uncharacterized protein n=1 Tax=Entomophthora muscae TaxID=34485 RepID=A0ACC2U0K3_9FUNG|nr:hypothetical protein DSO57_1027339 [Entomophthora muscae]
MLDVKTILRLFITEIRFPGALFLTQPTKYWSPQTGLAFLPPAPSIKAHKTYCCHLNLVAFPLSPALILIWTTSPDFWGWIYSSVNQVVDNPSHLLHFVEDLPIRAQNLLISDEYFVKSLTCDDLDPFLSNLIPKESYR